MVALLRWYLVVELLGLLTFPLAWRLFRRLPDRGWGVSKTLGVLLAGVTLWLGAAYGVLRHDPGGAVLAVLAVTGFALVVGRRGLERAPGGRRPLAAWMRARAPQILAVEAVFLLAFGGWALVRASDPAVRHTEQPMDLMLLSAVWTGPRFPPQDPWLAGYAVSYYYLGYWLLATLGRLAGTPPEIGYNVGQACWFGLLAAGCYSLGSNLAGLRRPRGAGGGWTARLGGGLTVCAVALAANPDGVVAGLSAGARWLGRALPWPWTAEAIPAASRPGPPWWWPPSRVLRDTDLAGRAVEIIDEFPFFSYLLGDDHPHLLAMPFGVLVVALALTLFLARGRASGPGLLAAFPLGVAGALVTVVAAGALVVLNAWDFPGAWLLLVLAAVAARGRRRATRIVTVALLVPAGALALCVPYFLTAQSQVGGVLPNLFHPTPLAQLARVFGVFAPGLAALVWAAWRERPPSPDHLGPALAAVLAVPVLGLAAGLAWAIGSDSGRAWLATLPVSPDAAGRVALERWAAGWPSAAVLIVLLTLAGALLRAGRRDPALGFALVLLVVGLVLVLAPEVAYVWDGFATRKNTVFKLYYQAWLLLGVAAAAGAVAALRRGRLLGALGAGAGAVVGLALAYAVAGTAGVLGAAGRGPLTLDGLAHLEAEAPDDAAAIRWVRAHTRPDARVVQAQGDSYRAEHGRIAMATGRPTLLGWRGHEVQWRGRAFGLQAAGRAAALEAIYRPPSPEALRLTLTRWAVDYVYLGAGERLRYGIAPEHEAVLERAMDLAFQHGGVRIFRRRG